MLTFLFSRHFISYDKFFFFASSGTQQPPTKQAIVQWFIRIEEIPKTKQKLLGREAHPNEIFLCEASNYENQINVETILKHVKVRLEHTRLPALDFFVCVA